MKFTIKQKILSMTCHYDVFDEKGAIVYTARTLKAKLLSNISLLDSRGGILLNMDQKLGHMGEWFDVTDGLNNFCFSIDETISLLSWFNRAKIVKGQIPIKIKSGPINLKAYITDEKGKYNKKDVPVVSVKRQLFKWADTFDVNVDETKLRPEIGILIGIWYDYMLSTSAIVSAFISTNN